jgi:hypothetical protein
MRFNHAKLQEVAKRALYAATLGKNIAYKLGKGGFHPGDSLPSRDGQCDCSGFVAWCLGLNRSPKPTRKWWIETSAMFNNATDRDGKANVFVKIDKPVVGCVVVYGDKNGHQGHTGVITYVDFDANGNISTLHGVDCSSGGSRKLGKAINLRNNQTILGDMKFFVSNGAIFCVLKEHTL